MQRDPIEVACDAFVSARSGRACSLRDAMSAAIAAYQAAGGWAQAQAEIDDLKTSVIAFCGPYAAEYARNHDFPRNHLHPTHYDILAKAGARMDDFVRGEWPSQSEPLARTREIQAAARRQWEGRNGR